MTSVWISRMASTIAMAALLGASHGASAQGRRAASPAMPPDTIPTFSTENLARKGFFYAGGEYAGTPGDEVMAGQMYVEVWVPKQIRQPYPIVFFHGNGQSGVDWQQTPDGRPGWAYYLIDRGYVVYMVDYPARGRSAYVPGVQGNLGIRTAEQLEAIWTAGRVKGNFPLRNNHTQWPGSGLAGDPIFDNFIRTQLQFVSGQAELTVAAAVPMLDMIGTPVILFTHSQGGGMGWAVADRRPTLVKAIVTVEPGGPQIGVVDTAKVEYTRVDLNRGISGTIPLAYEPPLTNREEQLKVYLEDKSHSPDEVPCYLQQEPVHKLVHLQRMRVLAVSANATYHRVFDACIPKWLNQAGVKTDFIRLEDVGIKGNSHMMMLEKNSDQVIEFIEDWIEKNVNNT
jgi:pimeloyl-ACP methyl ester carboxylesterase